MIALFGLVGGQHFAARLVNDRAEGAAWQTAHLKLIGEDQSTLQAYRQSMVITLEEAKRVRLRDGTCPFGNCKYRVWQWTLETVATADQRIAQEREALAKWMGEIESGVCVDEDES